jgi:hypothetical protein
LFEAICRIKYLFVCLFQRNSYLNALLSGTKVHEAISEARSGASCDTYFSKCPYSLNSINRSLADYAEKYVSQQENNEDFLDSFNDVPLE